MAMVREYGKEQPGIKLGIFTFRLPFIHYRWEISEFLQALLMCAACLGSIPILQQQLGLPFELAWSAVIINGLLYTIHATFGDPVIPGWITPSLPLTYAYLAQFPIGPERTKALIALQLLVAFLFLFLGITGLANKVMNIIPDAIKGGILIGASIGAVQGLFVESGNFWKYPISFTAGVLVSYYLLYSTHFFKLKAKYKLLYTIANFGMLPGFLVALAIGPAIGELSGISFKLGTFIKLPEIGNLMRTVSPFYIGFPGIDLFIKAIPMAFAVYIIAFGIL